MIGEHSLRDATVLPEPLFKAVEADDRPVLDWQTLKNIHAMTRMIYPANTHHGRAKRSRFLLRALFNLPVWHQWSTFIDASPFKAIIRHYPRLYEKPLRPYLHKDLNSVQRHRLLRDHYVFLKQHATPELLAAILESRPFILNQDSRGSLKEPLIINFTYSKHMQQEGELTLSLGPPDSISSYREHQWIASLTFLICRGASGWEIVIGGVQGGQAATGREDTKRATRTFHGLRPKHLLVHILREVAAAWGIHHLHAVGDSAHCYMRRRYRDRTRRMKSSYDGLWLELGGEPEADGFYELPAANQRRALHSIPSRKRAQYQRRFALLDDIDAEIRERLQVPRRG